MNLADVGTQLLFTTILIRVVYKNGATGSGTGLILTVSAEDDAQKSVPLLLTNLHVVAGADKVLLEFVEREGDGPVRDKRVRFSVEGDYWSQHVDSENDLAAFPIGPLLNQSESVGRPVFFRAVTPDLVPEKEAWDKLAAIEEITFIGYPSGLSDEHNATPLVRRGITATPPWNDFQGKPTFLIDAGVFPGSSGSPVFLYNRGSYGTNEGIVLGSRLLFLGILSESIVRTGTNVPPVFLGIGKVIKSSRVKVFVDAVAQSLLRTQQ